MGKMTSIKFSEINWNIVKVGQGATGSKSNDNEFSLYNHLNRLEGDLKRDILVTICDGDIIEEKNTYNQTFASYHVGKPKAEVLGIAYSRKYNDLPIRYIPQYITDEEFLIDLLLRKFDSDDSKYFPLLLGCVDNNSTRKLFHRVFYNERIKNLVYIDSGNGTDDMAGQVVVGVKRNGEVILPPAADCFPIILCDNDEIENHVGSCADTANEKPQNVATNVFAASIIFSIINAIIALGELDRHIVYFNAKTCETNTVPCHM